MIRRLQSRHLIFYNIYFISQNYLRAVTGALLLLLFEELFDDREVNADDGGLDECRLSVSCEGKFSFDNVRFDDPVTMAPKPFGASFAMRKPIKRASTRSSKPDDIVSSYSKIQNTRTSFYNKPIEKETKLIFTSLIDAK